jgi:autotransporter-associated beta strand protein
MHTCRSFQNIGIAIISCGALFPEARAGTVTYLGSGTLSSAASWDTAARPVTTDEALFINALPDPVTTAGGTNLEFGNFLWNSNSSSTIALNTTGTTSTQLRLTNGGGSTAAIANGGATDDLLLLGTAATSNTVIISGNLNTGTAQLEVFLQAAGNINVVNAGATLDIATRLRERNGVFGFNKTGAGTLILRGTNTYTGTTTLSEGTLALRNSNALSSGALTINGGTLASLVSARTVANNVTVNGNFNLGGLGVATTLNGTIDLSGGTRTITLGNSATIGGDISNGGLTVAASSGSLSLTLNAANTYGGFTTVSSGTLFVNGSLANTSGVSVAAGATLGGSGSIASSVTVGANGILAPGTSIDSLQVGSADVDGILEIEYDGTAGGVVDLLEVTGLLDIANASINFSQLGAAADDDAYIFATYGGLTGSFAPERVTGLPTSFPYFIDYNYLGANQIALVIPEPGAALITALGLLPLLRRRRP